MDGEFENAAFFEAHGELLRAAWHEYGLSDASRTTSASRESGTDRQTPRHLEVPRKLQQACLGARRNPSQATEKAVRSLFDEVAPGVVAGELLAPEAISRLRAELARVTNAGIPVRRPNGMNRHGVILDGTVAGGVANGVDVLVKELMDEYVRPIARTLFPQVVGAGDDVDYFAFTIQYNASRGGDSGLAEHRDASVVTLNLNLNTVEEFTGLTGSSLYFVDAHNSSLRHSVELHAGTALIHRGNLRHAATPLTGNGMRHNLVIWLFGKDGYVREAEYPPSERLTPKQRWSSEHHPNHPTVVQHEALNRSDGRHEL